MVSDLAGDGRPIGAAVGGAQNLPVVSNGQSRFGVSEINCVEIVDRAYIMRTGEIAGAGSPDELRADDDLFDAYVGAGGGAV